VKIFDGSGQREKHVPRTRDKITMGSRNSQKFSELGTESKEYWGGSGGG
jgi:hypothetical protein